MFTTVTLNPCLDRTAFISGFQFGEFNAVTKSNVDISGKGINVSVALAQLGVPIDPAHISGVTGAQLEGSVLTGLSDGSLVTYRYTDGPFSFTASLQFRVSNAWLEPLTMEDWTYGEAAHLPHADAQYGEPVYEYSDSENGVFTSQVPPRRAPGTCGRWCRPRTATPALWR